VCTPGSGCNSERDVRGNSGGIYAVFVKIYGRRNIYSEGIYTVL
jgi:hypothetical protein